VPLLKRLGNVLKVQGLDAVNGSPILDIKPYVRPHCGADRAKVPPWMEQIHRELDVNTTRSTKRAT
ncbi:MAG: TrmO family methyltransferase, partial [Desulfatiglandales bacterium]